MEEKSKIEPGKNFDVKFIGNHVHVDSAGKRTEYKAGDVGNFTEAEAEVIRKAGTAVLNTPVEEAAKPAAAAAPAAVAK